jgi:hypothetical protein
MTGPVRQIRSAIRARPALALGLAGCLSVAVIAAAYVAGVRSVPQTRVVMGPPQSVALGAPGRNAISRTGARLEFALQDGGFSWTAPVFLRLVKNTGRLELFLLRDGRFGVFRRYKLCGDSSLAPGTRTAATPDTVPEGVYAITARSLSVRSSRYMGVAVNWPNAADRGLGVPLARGPVLIDGRCAGGGSIGLTDQDMEEVYTLLWAALQAGQVAVDLHVYPAPLGDRSLPVTDPALQARRDQLQAIWLAGGNHARPPEVSITKDGYALKR